MLTATRLLDRSIIRSRDRLVITLVILRITWQSFQTIKADPGMPDEHDH